MKCLCNSFDGVSARTVPSSCPNSALLRFVGRAWAWAPNHRIYLRLHGLAPSSDVVTSDAAKVPLALILPFSRALQSKPLMHHLGVRKLRRFLERRVEECYRRNVARIVPLLQNELRGTEAHLHAVSSELEALSIDSLKQTANQFREHFSRALSSTIQGKRATCEHLALPAS